MTTFLWFFVVVEGLSCLGRIIWLASGSIPRRTPGMVALDLVAALICIGWALSLLITQGGSHV